MSARGNIKGFYQEKKKRGATSKSSAAKSKSSHSSATLSTNFPQPAALISHGSLDLKDDYDANEEMLRQFDMNMMYGPCIGMNRLARWERAKSLGMNPPSYVEQILKSDSSKVRSESLWDGRV